MGIPGPPDRSPKSLRYRACWVSLLRFPDFSRNSFRPTVSIPFGFSNLPTALPEEYLIIYDTMKYKKIQQDTRYGAMQRINSVA